MSVSYPPEVSFLSEPDKIRIHFITKWHLLFPASYSCISISVPCGFTCLISRQKYRVSTFHAIANCE